MAMPTFTTLKVGHGADLAKFSAFAPSIAAVIISIVVAMFIVWPKFSEVLRLNTANKELEIRSQLLKDKVQKLNVLSESDDALAIQLAAAEQLLPSDKGVFPLIAQIEGAAKASGVLLNRIDVTVGSINSGRRSSGDERVQSQAPNTPVAEAIAPVVGEPGSGADSAGASKTQVKLSMAGDYTSFLIFIRNSLSMARVITIHDLSVSAGDSAGQVQSSFVIDAYWKPLPTELAAVESSIEDISQEEKDRLSQVTSTGKIIAPEIPNVTLGRTDLFAPF